MKHPILAAAAATLLVAGTVQSATLPGVIGYALGNNGTTLVRIADLNAPAVATGVTIRSTSGQIVSMSDIDYRPATGQVYGYSDAFDAIYVIDTSTGVATQQAVRAGATNVGTLGLDFNNQVDAARIVSTSGANIVFFPNNSPPNIANQVTPPFYAAGDVNAGLSPSIFANAYTNAVPAASATLQYGIDATTDSLVTIANNAGTLVTQGRLFFAGAPLDVGVEGGLDILSFAEGDNTAIALLTAVSTTFAGQGLFRVPLAADPLGRINLDLLGLLPTEFGLLTGLTVLPVPLPAPAILLVGGLAALGAVRRRRGECSRAA